MWVNKPFCWFGICQKLFELTSNRVWLLFFRVGWGYIRSQDLRAYGDNQPEGAPDFLDG
jgi:hypothetical protein